MYPRTRIHTHKASKAPWMLVVSIAAIWVSILGIAWIRGDGKDPKTELKPRVQKTDTMVLEVRNTESRARVATSPFELTNDTDIILDVRNPGTWLRDRIISTGDKKYDPLGKITFDRTKPPGKRIDPSAIFNSSWEGADQKTLVKLVDEFESQEKQTTPPPPPGKSADARLPAAPMEERNPAGPLKESRGLDEIEAEINKLLEKPRKRIWNDYVEQALGNACLTLNNVALWKTNPQSFYYWEEWPNEVTPTRYYALKFHLAITDEDKLAWRKVMQDLGLGITKTQVSLAFPNLQDPMKPDIMPTEVMPESQDPAQRVSFRLALHWPQWVLITIFTSLFVIFVYYAFRTNLLRVFTNEDGLWHYSLGLCQMSWWFFIVSVSFVFLWIALGDYRTLTSQELLLVGIAVSSGLGSFLISNEKEGDPATARGEDALEHVSQVSSRSPVDLRRWMKEAERLPDGKEKKRRISELQRRIDFYGGGFPKKIRRFLNDLLAEDNEEPSFHRFQLMGWTLAFGIIFVQSVLHDLAMPAFSAEQLLLIGISNGTYLGFKWNKVQEGNKTGRKPAPNPNPDTAPG